VAIMMRALLCVLAFPTVLWAADKPDLVGRWELNSAQSKFGKMQKPVSMALTVTEDGGVLHAVQHTVDATEGQVDVAGDWYLDGKDHPIRGSHMTQMSKWDGKVLTADKKSADGTVLERISITFSSDGKVVTERVTVSSPGGNDTRVLVWNKKS
jgi:hypothetical protein